jgi:thiosulfate/3-mercaptopyruvate sulfurtransferase
MEVAKGRVPALVSTAWVAEHGWDDGVRLVEVDVDPTLYQAGHIKGAVGWNWTTDLQDQVRRDVLGPEDFAALMAAAGIGVGDHVVLYGDASNWFAAYAYWQLTYYGHQAVSLMDGGRQAWEGDGRPYTTEPAVMARSTYPRPSQDPSVRALQPEVLAKLGAVALVDVRSEKEFTGEVLAPPGLSETAQRGGHIPGAVNIPWAEAVSPDGRFKSESDLRELYGRRGIVADKPVVAYCRIGERSAHTWFVLRELLGYPDVKSYDGSWTEWGSMVGTPVRRGLDS